MSPLLFGALMGCSAGVMPPLDLEGLPGALSASDVGVVSVAFTSPGTARGEESESGVAEALIALIDAASTELLIALYDFDEPSIIAALERAEARGVDLDFVGDGDEVDDEGYLALDALGVPMSMRPAGNRIMHNKFVVVDQQAVWTGSTNATVTGHTMNNNNAVIVLSETLAHAYVDEHAQMAEGLFGVNKEDLSDGTRLTQTDAGGLVHHMAPTHDPITAMVDLVDGADHTVHYMIFSFTHGDLEDALLRAAERGVDVVGIYDESQGASSYATDDALAAAGIPVFTDGNQNSSGFSGGKLHHKVMLVDAGLPGEAMVTGSFNWSASATDANDENLLEIRDPDVIAAFSDEFCAVFAVATVHPEYAGELPTPCVYHRPKTAMLNEVFVPPYWADQGSGWVELFNHGTAPVDLRGWTMGDEGRGAPVPLSADWIEAGDSVVLDRPPWLNPNHQTITIFDEEGVLIDSVAVPERRADSSWTRVTDGDPEAQWVAHIDHEQATTGSSPGQRVDGTDFIYVPQFQLVLNELLANPTGTDLGQEFVEIVNLGPDEAVLAGWSLWDASNVQHVFTTEVLAPGQAVVLRDRAEDDSTSWVASTGHLSLNNTGDELVLLDADDAVHDQLSWSSSREGESWNRIEDGDPDAALIHHTALSTQRSSPGTRADGTAW